MNLSTQEEESPSARSYGLQKIRGREGTAAKSWFRLRAAVVAAAVAVLFILGTAAGQFAQAQVESVLHNFTGTYGLYPSGTLLRDSSGNLYGTALGGGSMGSGTVFELVYDSATNSYTEKVLHSFTGSDGLAPAGGLIMDLKGNLYGTTGGGGSSTNCGSYGCGTVFELVYDSSTNSYTEKVLSSFNGTNGLEPQAGLIMDSKGNLYGTTQYGGSTYVLSSSQGDGTVFELSPDSSSSTGYSEKVLLSFKGTNGLSPCAGLTMGSAGNLYGTTEAGGSTYVSSSSQGDGTVFELVYDSSTNSYTEKVLHSFTGSDGFAPAGGLIMDSAGDLYGTTLEGGTSIWGTVFELVYDSSTNSYTEKVLHNFAGATNDGAAPDAGLTMDSAGNLYGTTIEGGGSTYQPAGSLGDGTVFELSPDSSSSTGYSEKVLLSFNITNGFFPGSILNSAGNLYGSTLYGGSAGDGVVFGIAPVKLSATSLSFGSVAVDTTSAAQTVTITNTGTGQFSYSAVSISGANAKDFTVTNGCSTAVASNGTCSVSVTFMPSMATAETATLDLSQAGMTQTVSLSGMGVYPIASFSSSSLNFPSRDVGTTSSAQTVTLTNKGTVPLTITSVGITGDFAMASNTCKSSVAANGGTCMVGVTFKPTAGGKQTGMLSFTDNASNSPQTVALSGAGEDFTLTPRTTSETVAPGGSTGFDLLLSPQGGFNQAVSLACSGAPAHATCTVSPNSVTLNGTNNSSVSVKVSTAGNALVAPGPGDFGPPPSGSLPLAAWLAIFGLLGLMALVKFSPRGGRVRRAAPWATLALAAALFAGCGGGSIHTGVSSANSTPAGTYTLTVKATSGSLSQSTQITLNVQ